ncbi:Hypothetical predicted protein [Podarcis lilfordi]|uniref:Testis-specific protein 10-interacting protein n=2 Tax=Podarcis lilfordi TaxID=74358 RepID=A0AA35LKT6_9SAUR|nr:Hypothetical predicted protein [Podarcis lilfordi]
MLNPHRHSVLTNACVKPSVDPVNRIAGTIYEPKGRVRLLGLISESSPPQQEDYLDAGDGMLICMKRAKKRGPHPARKPCWEPEETVPNANSISDIDPEQELSRQHPVPPTPDVSNASPSPTPVPASAKQSRPGSFPFHWMWESISVNGQAMYQDRLLEKPKKKRSPQTSVTTFREPPCTPELGNPRAGSPKGGHCSKDPKPSNGVPEDPWPTCQKCHRQVGLAPGSSLLPLYWKMDSRQEARKRQMRQERHRWLQLTQELLSLEDQGPRSNKRFSLKRLEEKLRAELLCLATEPEEPAPQREARRAKGRAQTDREEQLTFQPTINRRIPNFKSLQRRFQEQLEQRKDQAKLTICKPFRLHSTGSSQQFSGEEDKQDPEDPYYEVRRLYGVHWRAHSCPDFGPPMVAPVMHTKTSDKRQEANRMLLLEWERQERKEKRRAELRRVKEQQVQREVAKCLATYQTMDHPSVSLQRKREVLRRQEKQRMEEYTLQLQEMQDRVESRPFLFERVMQANARQAVERRFSQVLAALGIDEEMLWKHAVRQSARKSSGKAMRRRTESPEDLPEST